MRDDSLPDRRSGYQWRPSSGRRSTPTCPRAKRTRELHAFGRAIRELRARRDLSQEELGFRSGLHRNYVGAIERGEINPTFRVLLKLERGLAMPLSRSWRSTRRTARRWSCTAPRRARGRSALHGHMTGRRS
jgi:ribosome-binding protein aMBF1 (putative translation factor)